MITIPSLGRAHVVKVTTAWAVGLCLASFAAPVTAQPIGTFRWRTEPYCNLVILAISQNGGVFTLDGFDEPGSGSPRLPLHGVAVPGSDFRLQIAQCRRGNAYRLDRYLVHNLHPADFVCAAEVRRREQRSLFWVRHEPVGGLL